MEHRREKAENIIKESIAEFIEDNSNRLSMITITNIQLTSDFKRADIFVTVFPEDQEVAGLDFLKRKRSESREYLKKNSRLSRIPHIDFHIDKGEKSRQRIDFISKDL